jgi:hypothetical protein
VKPDRRQKDKGYQSLPTTLRLGRRRQAPIAAPQQLRATISHHQAAFDFDDKPSEIG